jgi:DNA-binding CsgD family transcriptional regulator
VHRDDDVTLSGSSAVLAELDALLDRARRGEVTVAVVEGPAGIGKSMLLRRFRDRHPEVATVAVSGLPWERASRGALLERLRVAEGAGDDGDLADPAATGAVLARRWDAGARERPLVVAIDDAQHADPASLQAVVSAVARLRGTPLLLLLARGTGPDAGGDAEVADVLDRLAAAHVRVLPLTPEQVRLLAARLAGVDLPLPVARRLCEHTGGTPRHLLEILRDTPPARWADWQTPLPVPASVQHRVQAALDGCSAPCRALVEAAAVLGGSPVLADAAELGGLLGDRADPVAAFDEACAAGLLCTAAGRGLDTLAFPGAFVREAVHATLTPARRHCLHLRAAAVVGDETEQLRHRVEATPLPDPALADALVAHARRKAGDGAWAVVADALLHASRISPTRADREERLIQAVDALAGAGLLGQAVDALPEVEALPPGPRRDAVLAYVAIQRGRRAEAVSYLESAWRLRGADGHAAAVVCQRRVLHALADWDGDELVSWAERAAEHAEPGSPPAVEAAAIVGLGHGARGAVDAAFTAYRRAVADNPAGPQHQRARMGLGWLLLAQDDPEAARRELEFAAPTARRAGSNRISLWALAWLARTRFALGDWAGALHATDQAEVLLGTTGLELLRPLVHWTGAQVRALRAEDEDADRHLRLGAAESAYTMVTVPALLARAHLAEARSDYEAVVRHLAPLVVRSPRGGLDEPGFWPWHDLYANALVVTNRVDEADAFLRPLEAVVAQRRHRSAGARLGYVRGRLLGARGDLAGAEDAFARARAGLEPLPLPYEKARVDFAHGVTLRRLGRRRDAAELLTSARSAFAALGAQVYVARCDRELKTGRPAPRGTASDVLTDQERTVAALVATGRSNREVATEMMLSVKTVQFHLTRIYTKLGVRSRAELAARSSRVQE